MAGLTGVQITDAMQGIIAPRDTTGILNTNARFGVAQFVHEQIAVTANGLSTAVEVAFGQLTTNLSLGVNVTNAVYIPGGTLTANDTNYITMTLEQATPLGVITSIGSFTTQITGGSGNWTAQVPVNFSITAANANILPGNSVLIKLTQTGTGVAIPVGALIVNGVFV